MKKDSSGTYPISPLSECGRSVERATGPGPEHRPGGLIAPEHSRHVFLYPNRYSSGSFFAGLAARTEVREATHPKFYWFDPGVARAAAGLIREPTDRLWQGTALETLIFHELRVTMRSAEEAALGLLQDGARGGDRFRCRIPEATLGGPAHLVAIEVKRAEKWNRGWESGPRDLASQAGVKVDRLIAVYTGRAHITSKAWMSCRFPNSSEAYIRRVF